MVRRLSACDPWWNILLTEHQFQPEQNISRKDPMVFPHGKFWPKSEGTHGLHNEGQDMLIVFPDRIAPSAITPSIYVNPGILPPGQDLFLFSWERRKMKRLWPICPVNDIDGFIFCSLSLEVLSFSYILITPDILRYLHSLPPETIIGSLFCTVVLLQHLRIPTAWLKFQFCTS